MARPGDEGPAATRLNRAAPPRTVPLPRYAPLAMTRVARSAPALPQSACRVLDASVRFNARRLATPLLLSTGAIEEVTEAEVEVIVETAAGVRSAGRGSIYLSDLWAWPDPSLSHVVRDAYLRKATEQAARELPRVSGELAHPLEHGLALHHWICHELPNDAAAPSLALAMCASPLDAAMHDAVGLALGRSAFALFDEPAPIPSADRYFPEGGAVAAVRRLLQPPRSELDAWLIVNKTDALPAALAQAYARGGYRCFKLKISGTDNAQDAQRTCDVYRAAGAAGVSRPVLTVDSNELNPDAASVLDYLDRLASLDAEAYAALAYLEQPTGRDIFRHRYDWRAVAARKPVLLDEGLTDLDVLDEACAQGWSGLALKTCKGHSMLLAAAAWAHQRGMLLSLQDLTNPGISLIHAALTAAHLPTINGAEMNSPQFTPAANEPFLPRLSGLFEPRDGVHRLPAATPAGLGSRL